MEQDFLDEMIEESNEAQPPIPVFDGGRAPTTCVAGGSRCYSQPLSHFTKRPRQTDTHFPIRYCPVRGRHCRSPALDDLALCS